MKLKKRYKLLINFQLLILIFKSHFLLSSLYGLFEIPLLILVLISFKTLRFQKKFNYYLFYSVGIVFLISFLFNRLPRIKYNLTDSTEKKIIVHSYNLFFKNNFKQKIINEILESNSDILVVQELTPNWQTKLNSKLKGKYKFKALKPSNGTRGLGIYSKFPITKTKYFEQSQLSKIKIGKKELIIVNCHLVSPAIAVETPEKFIQYYKLNYSQREKQWNNIETHLNTNYSKYPILIAGDLNTMKNENLYRQIRKNWNDLLAKEGAYFNWTFPNSHKIKYPFLTLDYILHNNKIKGINGKVLKESSSDHLSIIGDIKI